MPGFSRVPNPADDPVNRRRSPAPLLGGVLVCCLLMGALPLSGCDVETFLPDEFEARCRHLIETMQQAILAQSLARPDLADRQTALLNEWVDFYADHGSIPVPSFTQVGTATWQQALKDIGRVVHEGTTGQPGDWQRAEDALLPLACLGEPALRTLLLPCRPAWLEESWPQGDQTPAEVDTWLRTRIVPTLHLMRTILKPRFPGQATRITFFMNRLGRLWKTVVSQPTEQQQRLALEVSAAHLFSLLHAEKAFWQQLLFWSE